MFLGELRPFQEEAVDRMVNQKRLLVAFHMGLGKTILTIAAVERLIESGEVGGGLIIVPATLKYQWERQIAKFTDGAISLVIDGGPEKRKALYQQVLNGEIEYTIMNYEQVVNDWAIVRDLPRDFIVCDEVTAIKGFKSLRTKRIKKMRARYQWGLSGQPVENVPEELFSVMEWVDPVVLGRFDIFDMSFIVRNGYGAVLRYKNLPTLHKKVSAAMVRKTRQDPDVRDQMPKVSEEVVLVSFDTPGRTLYRKIAKDLQVELANVVSGSFDVYKHYSGEGRSKEEMQQQGKIMARLTCLRMLCDHPELLRLSAKAFDDDTLTTGSKYASELKAAGVLKATLQAPKMEATLELIEDILSADPRNKVVLFSFFKSTLGLLKDATSALTKSVIYTGDMNAKQKDAAKQTFDTDPECVVGSTYVESVGDLLAVTRALYQGEVVTAATASGVGLSVTANHPVLTRRGWLPASDLRPGDEVFRQRRGDRASTGHDFQDAPLTAEQLFDAALAVGSSTSRSTKPGDFHGDAGAFQSEVDVVVVDHLLRDRLFGKQGSDKVDEVPLSNAGGETPLRQTFDGRSPLHLRGLTHYTPSGSGVSVSHVGGVTRPGPDLDTALGQQALDLTEPGGVLCHEVGDCGSFEVVGDEVLSVDSAVSSLHVYNLHTSSGIFLAESVVVHNCRLFLSSDAGGTGLDLPNANYLINYDLPWSAGKMDQRNARIIRLSTEFESVTLINMMMRGSIEERQYEMLERKRSIASAVMDGRGIDKQGELKLDATTLTEFLDATSV